MQTRTRQRLMWIGIAFFAVFTLDCLFAEETRHAAERFLIVDVITREGAQDAGVVVENLADGRRSAHPATLMGFRQRDLPHIRRLSTLTCSQYYRETPLLGWVMQDMLSCIVRPTNLGARNFPGTLL